MKMIGNISSVLLFVLINAVGYSQELWFQLGSKVPAPIIKLTAVEAFNAKQPNYNELNSQEKEVYYYTNVARTNPSYFLDSVVNPILVAFPHLKGKYANSLKSDLRKAGNLPFLKLQPKLNATAKAHANDMASATGDYFSHNSTNGQSFVDRMRKARINAYTAENISMGQQAVILSVVLLYLDIDVPDLGHRKTLLDPKYTQIGVGVSYKTQEQFYIVQDFSSEFYN
jgi:uncharacterized protein YkwD